MTVYTSGFTVRPSTGPYRCGAIKPGTRVAWSAVLPIKQIATAFDRHGITAYIIGDEYHRRGCQDHTPWSKIYGKVFATDVMYPDVAKLQNWLLGIMRGPEDTSFIDYININNSQYNSTGVRVAPSGDHHLHMSVTKAAANRNVSRFVDLLEGFLTGHAVPARPATNPSSAPGVFMALSDKEQDDLIYTMGIGAVAQKAGLRPLHVRVAELEKDIMDIQNTLKLILAEVKKP